MNSMRNICLSALGLPVIVFGLGVIPAEAKNSNVQCTDEMRAQGVQCQVQLNLFGTDETQPAAPQPQVQSGGKASDATCTDEMRAKGYQCPVQLTLDPAPAPAPAPAAAAQPSAPLPPVQGTGEIHTAQPQQPTQGYGPPPSYAIYDASGAQVAELVYVSGSAEFQEYEFYGEGSTLFIAPPDASGIMSGMLVMKNPGTEGCPSGPRSGPRGIMHSAWAEASVQMDASGERITINLIECGQFGAETLYGAKLHG